MRPFSDLSSRGQVRRMRLLADRAMADYRLAGARLELLTHLFNTTFRVTAPDGQRYTLRIQRQGHLLTPELRSELLWLAALRRETDLAVPEPVPTRAGELLTVAETPGVPEPRACVLFRWMDGRFLERQLTPRHLDQVGVLTARLQEHAARWTPPPEFTRRRVDSISGFARRQPDPLADTVIDHTRALLDDLLSPEAAEIVAAVLRRVRAVQQALGYGPDTFGLIHGDLHQENYLFHGDTVCAIDFDDCGYGHWLYDLMVTLLNVRHLPRYPELRAALLAGYRRVRPLPEEHAAYLDTFFALRCVQMMLWAIEDRHHPRFRDVWRDDAADELEQIRKLNVV